METEIIKIHPGEGPVSEEDEEKLRAAGAILQRGGLVAFPTETVYGLGGDALNPSSSQIKRQLRRFMRQRADRPTTH